MQAAIGPVNTVRYSSVVFLAFVAIALLCLSNAVRADETSPESSIDAVDNWSVKRQVLSAPGVFLDMSNLTDAGYSWTNDVVWEGAELPSDKNWFIAGFLFERPRYKGVWLQYSFSFNNETGQVANVRRWFGGAAFR